MIISHSLLHIALPIFAAETNKLFALICIEKFVQFSLRFYTQILSRQQMIISVNTRFSSRLKKK